MTALLEMRLAAAHRRRNCLRRMFIAGKAVNAGELIEAHKAVEYLQNAIAKKRAA